MQQWKCFLLIIVINGAPKIESEKYGTKTTKNLGVKESWFVTPSLKKVQQMFSQDSRGGFAFVDIKRKLTVVDISMVIVAKINKTPARYQNEIEWNLWLLMRLVNDVKNFHW